MGAGDRAPPGRGERILILAPQGRDGRLAVAALEDWQFSATAVTDMAGICEALGDGAGAVILAEEVLIPENIRLLDAALAHQPPWSDLPVIILTRSGQDTHKTARLLDALETLGNATLIERPVRPVTLASAVKVALRSRRRQYDIRDHLEREKQSRRHLEVVTAELSHRVKNTLATVQAIASQGLRHAHSLNAFEVSFLGRLRAFATGHTLLTASEWRATDLGDLLDLCLKPYAVHNVTLAGRPVKLTPKETMSLTLIFHEMATNAAKYGAFSRDTGRLEISWSRQSGPSAETLDILWQERGGPATSAPENPGFGSKLLGMLVTHDLEGTLIPDYGDEGFTCRIVMPLPASAERGSPQPI